MIATQSLAQAPSNESWLITVLIIAIAAAALILFAAWANRRWRRK